MKVFYEHPQGSQWLFVKFKTGGTIKIASVMRSSRSRGVVQCVRGGRVMVVLGTQDCRRVRVVQRVRGGV